MILDKKKCKDKVDLMPSDDKTHEQFSNDPTPKFKRKLVDILETEK